MKFKPGDKVYSYRHGIVTLVETEDTPASVLLWGLTHE